MGRCEMVWTTAGTNRVCSRCLALKNTVVGYTDELGVTLPPLHPRCRCAIAYREVARGLAAGNIDTTTTEGSPPKLIERIEFTPSAIQKTLERYEAQIVDAPIENGIVITKTGEVYHCTGDLNTLDSIVALGEKLEGSYITHNHPLGSVNEYTFGGDDERFFVKYKPAILRGVDEKFLYELNRNADDNEFAGYVLHELYSLGLDFEDPHVILTLWALTNGFGYWRCER